MDQLISKLKRQRENQQRQQDSVFVIVKYLCVFLIEYKCIFLKRVIFLAQGSVYRKVLMPLDLGET